MSLDSEQIAPQLPTYYMQHQMQNMTVEFGLFTHVEAENCCVNSRSDRRSVSNGENPRDTTTYLRRREPKPKPHG